MKERLYRVTIEQTSNIPSIVFAWKAVADHGSIQAAFSTALSSAALRFGSMYTIPMLAMTVSDLAGCFAEKPGTPALADFIRAAKTLAVEEGKPPYWTYTTAGNHDLHRSPRS